MIASYHDLRRSRKSGNMCVNMTCKIPAIKDGSDVTMH